jgi:hypothetical protein
VEVICVRRNSAGEHSQDQSPETQAIHNDSFNSREFAEASLPGEDAKMRKPELRAAPPGTALNFASGLRFQGLGWSSGAPEKKQTGMFRQLVAVILLPGFGVNLGGMSFC